MATQNVFLVSVMCILVHFVDSRNLFNESINISEQYGQQFENYLQARNALVNSELGTSFGNDIKLSVNEEIANKIIMAAKANELNIGLLDPKRFSPARHIFDSLGDIKESKLFKIIQKMPKGGILHTHDMSMCSADYVVSLTYLPDLWQRTSNNSDKIEELRFSRQEPSIKNSFSNESTNSNSTWRLVSAVRAEFGAKNYDRKIRSMLTIFDKNVNAKTQFTDISDIWPTFIAIFAFVNPLLSYVPVRKAYYKQALKEMLDDGVQYMEFRSNLAKRPSLYDLDGSEFIEDDLVAIFIEALDEFKRENPSFIGSKLISSGNKWGSNEMIAHQLEVVQRLHTKYPQFVGGFDLDNLEEKSPPLASFAERILQLPKDIPLLFHAGETNWFGGVDENLYDAVLLGSRRIGHAYALAKHPKLIDLIKEKDIALEINPISNQVLRLVDDFRNHPLSIYLAQNIPIVISSDNFGFWEVSPLSYDFYTTFLGIASRHSDLRILKKFAINSIAYSLMNETEKIEAYTKWQKEWDKFIDDLVNEQENEK